MHAKLVPFDSKHHCLIVDEYATPERYEIQKYIRMDTLYKAMIKVKMVEDGVSEESQWFQPYYSIKIRVKPLDGETETWPSGAIVDGSLSFDRINAPFTVGEEHVLISTNEFRLYNVAVHAYGLDPSQGVGEDWSDVIFMEGWDFIVPPPPIPSPPYPDYNQWTYTCLDDLGWRNVEHGNDLIPYFGSIPIPDDVTANSYLFIVGGAYKDPYYSDLNFVRVEDPTVPVDPSHIERYSYEDGEYILSSFCDLRGTVGLASIEVEILDMSDDSITVIDIPMPDDLPTALEEYTAVPLVNGDGSFRLFQNERSFVLRCDVVDIFNPFDGQERGYLIKDGFMNVHLSSFKGGGVCFGGHSDSEEVQKAMFQCYYPAYFYDGIATHDVYPGDSLVLNDIDWSSDFFFHGLTTASTTSIYFSIPIRGKISEKVVDVSVDAFECWILNSGGYGLSSSFKTTADDYLPYLVPESLRINRRTNTVFIQFDKSSGFNFTNNNAVTARVSALANDMPVSGLIILYFSDEYQYDSLSTSSATASTTYSSSYPVSNLFNPNKSTVWASKGTDEYPTLTFTFAREYYGIHLEFYSRDNATLGWSPEYITMSAWLWSDEIGDYEWVEIGSIEDIDVEEHSGGYIGSLEIDSSICTSKILLSMKKADIANYVAMGYIDITAQIRKGL